MQRQAVLEEGKGTLLHSTLESIQSHLNGHGTYVQIFEDVCGHTERQSRWLLQGL